MQRGSGQFLYFQRATPSLVGLQHFKTKAFQIKFLAGRWNLSAHMAQKSRDCRDRSSTESPKWTPSISSTSSMAVLPRMTSELVLHGPFQVSDAYLPLRSPNDLFHQIFHRCNSRDASVFVDNYRQLLIFCRISLNSSEPIFVSGMNITGFISSRTFRFVKSASATCNRSCE